MIVTAVFCHIIYIDAGDPAVLLCGCHRQGERKVSAHQRLTVLENNVSASANTVRIHPASGSSGSRHAAAVPIRNKTGAPMSAAVIVYVIEIAAKVIFQNHGIHPASGSSGSRHAAAVPIRNVSTKRNKCPPLS